jgi:hypothetical protein
LEFGGRGGGERRAYDAVAVASPRIGGSGERGGLAGPGRRDHDIDTVARGRECGGERDLLARERRMHRERRLECGLGDDPDAAITTVRGLIAQTRLERDELRGRIPGETLAAGTERHDAPVGEQPIRDTNNLVGVQRGRGRDDGLDDVAIGAARAEECGDGGRGWIRCVLVVLPIHVVDGSAMSGGLRDKV